VTSVAVLAGLRPGRCGHSDGRVFSANGLGALVLISRTAAAEKGSSLNVSRRLAGAPLLDLYGSNRRICTPSVDMIKPEGIPAGAQRANTKNPTVSPTTVMCPLQGATSSRWSTSPACNCLVSPSVAVMENIPWATVRNWIAGVGW
jgi:hypothetical protein